MIANIDLSILINLILLYYAFILCYGLVIGIRAIIKKPNRIIGNSNRKNLTENPKFLVLIPAHNEENVVNYLIRDIITQNYNSEHIRALVIADNCTDGTHQSVKELIGNNPIINVFERNSSLVGKPAALNDALAKYKNYFNNFIPTNIVILDSDNRIGNTFLHDLSLVIKEGYQAIQVNVKTKNPNSSIVSRCDHYESLLRYRLTQFGKDKLFAPTFDGTGQCINYDLLASMAISDNFFGNSSTEDFWLTIKLADRGIRIKYEHHIITWDEKPKSFIVEVRRRARWIDGYIECFGSLVPSLIRRPNRLKFDLLMGMTGVLNGYIFWVLQIMAILLASGIIVYNPIQFFGTIEWVVFSFVSTQILYTIICWIEKDKKYILFLPFYGIFTTVVWIISAAYAIPQILSKQKTWYHTPHFETKFSKRLIDLN